MVAALDNNFATGALLGTGSAVNIEIGWVPDFVRVYNATDGDTITEGWIDKAVAFTSGGTYQVLPGDTLTGDTSGATAIVRQVLLVSGTWAGGDAAGWFLYRSVAANGVFGSENVSVTKNGTTNSNVATVVAAVEHGSTTTGAVAAATGNAGCLAYDGTAAGFKKGFTIGSTVSESGKLLRWTAWRQG